MISEMEKNRVWLKKPSEKTSDSNLGNVVIFLETVPTPGRREMELARRITGWTPERENRVVKATDEKEKGELREGK